MAENLHPPGEQAPPSSADGLVEGRAARILIAAFGDAGHAFPAIGLAQALDARGHDVVVETWERWREPVEGLGLRFEAAEEYRVFPPPPPGEGPGVVEAARALFPLIEDFRPDLVVSDVLTQAPALAAEVYGVRRATLVPHLYPESEPGMPFFAIGALPPRTPVGRAAWRAAMPLLRVGLDRGRRELDQVRASLGLGPSERDHWGLGAELTLVGTYPALEYPREWPEGTIVCGPLEFEIPHEGIELPAGEEPLVLVASSTAHDPRCELVRVVFEALANEPVRVLATSNGHMPADGIEVPANAELVGWLSYTQVMPEASLVISHGGHGTVCRALGAGRPLLISPAIGDMAENAIRVQWAGAGLALPSRLRTPLTVRTLVRELLERDSYATRAGEIGRSVTPGQAAERACEAIEEMLGAGVARAA